MPLDRTYPVLSGDDEPLPQCIGCQQRCGEPGNFLVLDAGAILHRDASRQFGGPDELMSAYLRLTKHGAEPRGPVVDLYIVEDLIGGQAELYFCSASCLRRFFSSVVDELESRWLQA
jgi:hypothetical protein